MGAVAPQQAQITRLHRETREHKSEERRHRRLAKEKAIKRDELLAECKRLGIVVQLHPTQPTHSLEA